MPEYFLCSKASGEEITLGTAGEHVIGRGPLLKVTDKRVSRNHAILKITNDGLAIHPQHSNPCFYKAVNEDNFTPVRKDTSQVLHDKDIISLLPNEHVYTIKVVHTPTKLIEDKSEENVGQLPAKDDEDKKIDTRPAVTSAITTGRTGSKTTENDSPKDNPISAPCKVTIPPPSPPSPAAVTGGKTRKLPAWLLGCATNAPPKPLAKKKVPTASRRKPSTDVEPQAPKVKKRKVSVSENEEEKLATPPPSPPPPPPPPSSAVAQKPQVQRKSKEDDAHKRTAGTKPAAAGTSTKLPVCPYGKQCYRKNPLHFKEYSHSDQEDEDDDDKPECEYGTSCYRKNPAHLAEYKHTQPPAAAAGEKRSRSSTRPKRDKKKKTVLSGDSDDDGEPNTYDYNDSFIDDDDLGSSSSTSYGPDSEDEDWEPVGDSEDVSELVQDAESFMTNKKMHRTS